MRCDAVRNRDRILQAGRELFVTRGVQVPMEEIAALAQVGIGTLYRHFPDRFALSKAVAIQNMGRVAAEVQAAMAEEPDSRRSLARVLHRVYELKLGDPIPILLPHLIDATREDAEFQRARGHVAEVIRSLLDQARTEGVVRQDVTVADVLTLATARPQPAALLDRSMTQRLSARFVQIILAGLRPNPGTEPMTPVVDETELEERFVEP